MEVVISQKLINLSMMESVRNNQLVGNIGLFYICYELSKRGWNCLPTTRNAKGVDLIIYSQNAKKHFTIQVKSLSRRNPVPFGANPRLIADFVVIVRNVFKNPEVFIMPSKEVQKRLHKRQKNGRISYWLQLASYENFKDKWELIGEG